MRRLLFSLCGFCAYLVPVYFILVFIWGIILPNSIRPNLLYLAGANGQLDKRIGEISTYTDIDILFLGSSHSYRGFDTRIFARHGYRTFNLGSSNQTHLQTEVLLDQYLDHLNPKMVIYEVYPKVFANDGVESSLDMLANNKIDLSTIKMVLQINHIKTYNTLMFAMVDKTMEGAFRTSVKRQRQQEIYVTGGYVEREVNYNEDFTPREKRTFTFSDQQYAAFLRNLELLSVKGIPYILVRAPVASNEYLTYHNNWEIDSTFHTLGTYFNFNERLQLSDSLDFQDPDHLNQHGVEKFNHALLPLIEEHVGGIVRVE